LDAIVVGCGAIGAAIGVALASKGMRIGLYDRDPCRRAALADKASAFAEPEMAQAMRAATAAKRLRVLDGLALRRRSTHFIVCTPTPVDEAGEFDPRPLEAAIGEILDVAQPDDAIFLRSTVPIGATRRLAVQANARGLDLRFASTIDRSIEGRGFADQFSVPQIIGGIDEQAAQRAAALFAPLGNVIDLGSAEAAEAAKLFCNAWRATLFAASNAMAMACETHGLDVYAIMAGASQDYPRFSPPRPGPVGGPCLPKDLVLLSASVPEEAAALLRGATASESHLRRRIAAALNAHLAGRRGPLRVALAGVAFKGRPPVDDARGSVALALAADLRARWPEISILGMDAAMTPRQIEEAGLLPAKTLQDAAAGADLVVFCNDHPAFAQIDIAELARIMARGGLIYDLQGVTPPFHAALPNDVRRHILGRGGLETSPAWKTPDVQTDHVSDEA
jgi:UDP-N-acetyl-D-mannosaminuronic acid dehydrogenase